MKPKVIVGLGNPGQEYLHTRHNIGFIALEQFSSKHNILFFNEKRHYSLIGKGFINKVQNFEVICVKPQTYMNLSGKAIKSIFEKYQNLDPTDLIIIHDDVDLSFGKIKIKLGGGDGGHKGVHSIINELGSNNFIRVRIGIGRSQSNQSVREYVLSNFLKCEMDILNKILTAVTSILEDIVTFNVNYAMNKYNGKDFITT